MLTRRRMLVLSLASLPLLVPGSAKAAEVEITAFFHEESVEVGEGTYLEVEVAVTGGDDIGQPRFTGSESLTIQTGMTSSGVSVQFGGGSRTSQATKTYTYVVSASSPGEYELGIEVEVDGKKYSPTNKPKLIVGGSAPASEPVTPELGAVPTSDDEIIVWPVVDAAEVWVGQQVIYELQVWARIMARMEMTKLPTFKDFWTEELEVTRQQRRSAIAGVPYDVFTYMRRALFPQKAGTLTIEAATVRAGGSVGLFGGGKPPRDHRGRAFSITVKPLPAAGQPPNFSANNVGRYKLSSEVDRTKLVQGEALRLTAKVEGTGNIALVSLGEWPQPAGMKAYEAKPDTPKLVTTGKQLTGSRSWSMLLVAERAGTLTIPALTLDYFDPGAGEYRKATTKPITIEVEANPDAAPPRESGEPGSKANSNEPSEPFAAPRAGDALARVELRERWLTPERWWRGILAAPALLGLGALASLAKQRLGPDEQTRARTAERRLRGRLLEDARGLVEQGDGFHAKLAEALQRIAVERAGPAGVGLTRERLMDLLRERGVASEELERMRTLLDACDAARFGAGVGDAASRRAQLDEAARILDAKAWRAA